MGLDSYLYKTSRAEQAGWEKFCKEFDSNVEKFTEVERELKAKYSLQDSYTREEAKEKFTSEEFEKWSNLLDATLYRDADHAELGYWRKAWPLHEFIAGNFLPKGMGDNCERIYLSREDVKKVVEWLKGQINLDDVDDSDNFWDNVAVAHSLEVFLSALDCGEDEVVYFYSWY